MIPKVYKNINPSDVSLIPLKVHKPYSILYADMNTNGYKLRYAKYSKKLTPISETQPSPTLNTHGHLLKNTDDTYYSILWYSINQLYYNIPYGFETKEHPNQSLTYKTLPPWFVSINIPYHESGETIRPKSLKIYYTGVSDSYISDDGHGNLCWFLNSTNKSYVPEVLNNFLNTYSPAFNLHVNDFYKELEYTTATSTSSPTQRSLTINEIKGTYPEKEFNNITFKYLTYSNLEFKSNSYIRYPDSNKLDLHEQWLINIPFVLKSQVNEMTLLSKKLVGKIKKQGIKEVTPGKYRKIEYSEDTNVPPTSWPYHITIKAGKINFTKSNGKDILTHEINSALTSNKLYQLVISRYYDTATETFKLAFYLVDTSTSTIVKQDVIVDIDGECVNIYDLIIGNYNNSEANEFSLGDIRIYNSTFINKDNVTNCAGIFSGLPTYNITKNPFEIYTGNIFYRNGQIVLHANTFTQIEKIEFEGTHTIYEYETLCRVKKGEFNLTLNPSARRNFKSDQFNKEFIEGNISPYVTSIGLYNEKGDLLVVAKLGQPVQMRDDVDINFLIKWEG